MWEFLGVRVFRLWGVAILGFRVLGFWGLRLQGEGR